MLRKLLRTFVPVLLGLGALFFIASLLRLVRGEDLSMGQVAMAAPWLVPFLLPYLIPVAYLVTVALVVGRLVADNEVLALVSLGIPQRAVAWPAALLAVPLCALSLWLGAAVVPHCYQRSKEAARAVFEQLLTLGDGEHLAREFEKEGFDLYVRKYGPDGLEGIVIHYDIMDYGGDVDSTQPVQVVAQRGRIAPGSRTERLALTLEDVTTTVQARGPTRYDDPPSRVRVARWDQGIGLSGRRRIKPADFATADLRREAERWDARHTLAAATGGLVAGRAGADKRGPDARLEVATRGAISLAPLLLAMLAAPLTFLIGARSPLVPLVASAAAASALYFTPLLMGRSLAETTGAAWLPFLGCAVAGLAAIGLGLLAGQGAPGAAGAFLAARGGDLLGRLRPRRAQAPAPGPTPAPTPAPTPTPTPTPARPPRSGGLLRRLPVPILDRWLAGRFVRAWLAFAATGALLFLIIDLFTNLENLSRRGGLWGAVQDRYALMFPEVFFTVSPFLTLLAALWVVVQLRRGNELVSLLAAGVGPIRIAAPLLACGALIAPLVWLDREHLLPRLGHLRREARLGDNMARPRPIPDEEGGVLAPRFYVPADGTLRDVRYVRLEPEAPFRERLTVLAASGRRVPEGWRLDKGFVVERTPGPDGRLVDRVAPISSATGYTLVSRVTPQDVEASIDAPAYLSAKQLRDQLRRTPGFKHLAVQLHERATAPLAGLVLLLLALPIALGGQGGWDAFLRVLACVGLSGLFFLASSLCYELGAREALSPAVAAWAPTLLFGGAGVAGLLRATR